MQDLREQYPKIGERGILDIYIVQEGDTVWSISQKYAVPVGEILKANPEIKFKWGSYQTQRPKGTYICLKDEKGYRILRPEIYVGQKIVIPEPTMKRSRSHLGFPPNRYVDKAILVIELIMDSPHSPAYLMIAPGSGEENRCYYNDELGYYEWSYYDQTKQKIKVSLFLDYTKKAGKWRGTYKYQTFYIWIYVDGKGVRVDKDYLKA